MFYITANIRDSNSDQWVTLGVAVVPFLSSASSPASSSDILSSPTCGREDN